MQSTTNPRAELLRDSNFRWLMAGSAVSLLGDQFTLIALPWLVLRMTGDTAALGTGAGVHRGAAGALHPGRAARWSTASRRTAC